jgi:glycosyltransferase involved in cell wall biosynthesis
MISFSVIMPLYNKRAEVERALHSVLAQTLVPMEIVVVDDGSTDGSAAVVKSIGSPLIKLISQPNAGVSAARNRAMTEAGGDYFAFLDADDEWRPGFLAEIAALIEEFPDAGLYCTGFDIIKNNRVTPGRTPTTKGIVADYFGEAMERFVATASSAVVPRRVVDKVGGFPEGMSLGEDQYMWTKIALQYTVVSSPARLAVVHASASNRSAAIYTPEATKCSFRDFHDPGNPLLEEYIARVELGKAITATVKGGTDAGRKAERDFAPNRRSRRLWWRLWLLNRLPASLRPTANNLYTRLAWFFAKKGV